jgi:type IV pilus assembly protein PilB
MPEPTSAPPEKKLGKILVDADLLTVEQLEQAAEEAGRLQIGLLAYLLDEGLVSPEDAAMALSLEINLPIIDLKRHAVRPEALSLVPGEYARRHELIPINVVGDALVVVMADPTNIDVLEDLKARAISEGMITMRRAGMLKVQEGITTPHEVIRNVFSIV